MRDNIFGSRMIDKHSRVPSGDPWRFNIQYSLRWIHMIVIQLISHSVSHKQSKIYQEHSSLQVTTLYIRMSRGQQWRKK